MDDRIQPIETAPKDGTVVLTEEGLAVYIDPKRWASPVEEGWQLCYEGGNPFHDSDDGWEPFRINPKWWMPIPEFPN
jgi:hypothetical protein